VLINIHLPITSPLLDWALKENERIVHLGGDGVIFSAGAIPHITLLAGSSRSAALPSVMEVVRLWSTTVEPQLAAITSIHQRGRYIMAEVHLSPGLAEERYRLADNLSALMEFTPRGRPSNGLHLTLGHTGQAASAIGVLGSPPVGPPPAVLESVQLSGVGAHGTCVDAFWSVRLDSSLG